MKVLIVIIRIIDNFSKWISIAVSTLLPAMICVLMIEVICRYVLNRPTQWAYDVSIFMFGYVGILGGVYIHKLKEHINVDVVYSRLSTRTKAVMDSITGCLVIYFLILIILYTWGPAMEAFRINETKPTEWGPPTGHFKLLIPVGTFFLFLQQLANWVRSLYRVITDKELGE